MTRTLTAWAVSALLTGYSLFGAAVHAQPSPPGQQPVAKEAAMRFDIPEHMRIEHEELHAALADLTKAPGRTGAASQAVARVLEPHFARENEYALPPLSLLRPLAEGKFEPSMADVLPLTDRLEAEMPAMLAEHKDIAAALKELHDAATAENNAAGIRFAEHLAAHAQEEEEFMYPAALLIGRYVKLNAAQKVR